METPRKENAMRRDEAETPSEVGGRNAVAQAMRNHGLSRAAYARLLGVHPSRVTNVLNGVETSMSLRTLDRYLSVLGYTAEIRLRAVCGERTETQ